MGVMGNVHSVETFGTVDGPGIRYVIFMQGCPLRCKFCHNPDTWEMGRGTETDSAKVIDEIRQYREFYKSSGGGVTASGGEPTLQAEFVQAVFTAAKEMGLNTALDTSGYTNAEKIDRLLDLTDLVLLDIKETGETEHEELTGVELRSVHKFAFDIQQRGIPVWIRHVIIPGLTGNPERVRELGKFLLQFENIKRVELLGYHKLGSHKWELKGCHDPLAKTEAATVEEVERARSLLIGMGLNNVM